MTPKGFTDDPRRDVPLKTVFGLNHPWEQDFSKREALEALAIVSRYSEQGHLSATTPTIAWYEDSRLMLKIQAPTTAIDIVDQLIEQTYPSGVYDDEEIIGGQHSPPERIEGLTPAEQAFMLADRQIQQEESDIREASEQRITQLPIQLPEPQRPQRVRRTKAEVQRAEATEDPDTPSELADLLDRDPHFESFVRSFVGRAETGTRFTEPEEAEQWRSADEREATEYCEVCDKFYPPGTHSHEAQLSQYDDELSPEWNEQDPFDEVLDPAWLQDQDSPLEDDDIFYQGA